MSLNDCDKKDKKEKNNEVNTVLEEKFKTAIDSKDLNLAWNPIYWNHKEFLCGWGSAFINICITYPINKVTFRQMLHNISPLSALQQVWSEGMYVLYRGILPPLCQKTTSLSLMFGVYESVRVPLSQTIPSWSAKALAALIAGTAEASLAPFERVQTLLQDKKYQSQFTNMNHAFLRIGQDHGFREYYRGLVPILVRNGPTNILYFFFRDEVKELFSENSTTYGRMFGEFVCGGLIGAAISTLAYPLNVVKIHMQSRLGGEFQGLFSAFSQIYQERGRKLEGFYRGVHLNYTRGFISWGVITVSSETIRRLIY